MDGINWRNKNQNQNESQPELDIFNSSLHFVGSLERTPSISHITRSASISKLAANRMNVSRHDTRIGNLYLCNDR